MLPSFNLTEKKLIDDFEQVLGVNSSNMKANYCVSMTTSIIEETSRRTIVETTLFPSSIFRRQKSPGHPRSLRARSCQAFVTRTKTRKKQAANTRKLCVKKKKKKRGSEDKQD